MKRYLGDNYLKGDNIKVVINLNKQTAKLEQLRQEKEEVTQKLEAASSVASDKKTIVCGNCHLRLGHTKKKCALERCTDEFLCGQEKQHPGQINRWKMDQAISRQEKIVSECKAELKRHKTAVQTVKNCKARHIENRLLENSEACGNELGHLKWNLVRKHATMISTLLQEKYEGFYPRKRSDSRNFRQSQKRF